MIGDWKSPIQFDLEINTQKPFCVYCVLPPTEVVLPSPCGRRVEAGSIKVDRDKERETNKVYPPLMILYRLCGN